MNDPFESLLESALSAPDLELGCEMRRRLLAAAAPAGNANPENIVNFEVPDPDATAGFDWLVGDAPATRPLIRRMSGDPGFLTVLDDERRFLRSLRRSLRRPAAVAPKRRLPAVLIAAAAALTIAAGTFLGFPGPRSPGPASIAKTGPVSPTWSARSAPLVEVSPDHPNGASVPDPGFPSFDRVSDGPVAKEPTAVFASFAEASRTSGTAGDEITSLEFSLENAGSATFGSPDPAVTLLEDTSNPAFNLVARNDMGWKVDDLIHPGFPAGPGISFSAEEDRASVPEPGGMLPVMIGCLMLVLRRPERTKSAA